MGASGQVEGVSAAAHEVAGSTAQLVAASRARAPPDSPALAHLTHASRDVAAATGALVAAVKAGSALVLEQGMFYAHRFVPIANDFFQTRVSLTSSFVCHVFKSYYTRKFYCTSLSVKFHKGIKILYLKLPNNLQCYQKLTQILNYV